MVTPSVDDGPNGGQSVYTLWTGDADAIKTVLSIGQQLYEPPCANLQAQEQRHLEGTDATDDNDLNSALDAGCEDAEDLYTEINRRHQGYAVPPWSMNRAVWRFLLTGPPEVRSEALCTALCRLLGSIRHSTRVPVLWATSYTHFADKSNGKSGCSRW